MAEAQIELLAEYGPVSASGALCGAVDRDGYQWPL